MIISASLTFTEVMFPVARIQGAKVHEVDVRYVTTFDLIQVQGETASYNTPFAETSCSANVYSADRILSRVRLFPLSLSCGYRPSKCTYRSDIASAVAREVTKHIGLPLICTFTEHGEEYFLYPPLILSSIIFYSV